MQNNAIVYNLDNDADWLQALHGNAYTKWSPVSQTMFLRADPSRRVHGGERKLDKRN